jgi:hypothetical protein
MVRYPKKYHLFYKKIKISIKKYIVSLKKLKL